MNNGREDINLHIHSGLFHLFERLCVFAAFYVKFRAFASRYGNQELEKRVFTKNNYKMEITVYADHMARIYGLVFPSCD